MTFSSSSSRQQWEKPHHFLTAALSYTLGLGVVWRLPSLFYKNGGVAFLVPYFTCILFLGLPLLAVESLLGQATQTGFTSAWPALGVPIFKGLGYAGLAMAAIINVYYIVVLAWSAQYWLTSTFSMDGGLASISSCSNAWNTQNCSPSPRTSFNKSMSSPQEEFFRRNVLGIDLLGTESSGSCLGYLQPTLVITLFVSWFFVYAYLVRGARSIRWGSLVSGILPPIFLVTLSLLALFLPGALTGLSDYLHPRFYQIWSVDAWVAAATQVLFSYGFGLGAMTALGSYISQSGNLGRQMKLLVAVHTVVGLVTVLGFYALAGYLVETDFAPDAKHFSGPRAIFVMLPRALASLPGSGFWGTVIYGLLFILGLGSQAITVEGVMVPLMDKFGSNNSNLKRRSIILGVMCAASFGLGLLMVTQGGQKVFNLFDNFGAPVWILNVVVFGECVLFGRYGMEVVEEKTGFRFGPCSRVAIRYLTPAVLLALQIAKSAKFLEFIVKSLHMSTSKMIFGWALLLTPIIMAIVGTIEVLVKSKNKKSGDYKIKQVLV